MLLYMAKGELRMSYRTIKDPVVFSNQFSLEEIDRTLRELGPVSVQATRDRRRPSLVKKKLGTALATGMGAKKPSRKGKR